MPAPPTAEARAMRVAIARDVLAQLDREDVPLDLTTTMYLSGRLAGPYEPELRDCVDRVQAGCTVCLLAACVLSRARLYGGVPTAAFRLGVHHTEGTEGLSLAAGRLRVVGALADVFDRDTLDAVEAAFMCTWMGEEERRAALPLSSAAVAFGHRYDADRAGMLARARAVMANIVAHDGEFRPDLPAPAPGVAP
jgi:hypothetical protein